MVATSLPAWEAHPDVWLVVGLLAAGYAVAVQRLGPRHAPPGEPPASRFQIAAFSLGLLALWLSSDWPVHDVSEGYLYSVHMLQHLVIQLVAVPLLLLGTPGWMLRLVLRPDPVFRTVRWLARFLPALIVFNAVLVFTHWPAIVNATLESGLVHLGYHTLMFVAGFIMWLPVLSPVPEIPRLAPLPRLAFLFLQSVVPTVPASFLTFGSEPLYRGYEALPKLWGLTALEDQLIAGLIMKIGAGLLLWAVIAVIFFRWFASEEREERERTRRAHRLDRMGLTS